MKLKISSNKCTGCQLCQLACSAAKNANFGVRRSRVQVSRQKGSKERIIVCRQCKRCKCIEACNYDAFKKDEKTGAVFIDKNECQACFACIDACPFKAVRIDHEEKIPMVCDLCGGNPPCVSICYAGALKTIDTKNSVQKA
jgi:anaerobic carbon-monoxide dehydrogenase iron sulfur subunit